MTSLEKGPLEFKINTSEFDYLDLEHVYLYTKSRILDGQNRPIPSMVEDVFGKHVFNRDGVVFPVNNFHSSQFKSVEVYINDQQVNEADHMYAYRSYLEFILTYNKEEKNNLGRMAMWEKDNWHVDGNFVNMDDLKRRANVGGWRIFEKTRFSQSFVTMGKIHSELLCRDRFLPSNCQLRLRLHRADTSSR